MTVEAQQLQEELIDLRARIALANQASDKRRGIDRKKL